MWMLAPWCVRFCCVIDGAENRQSLRKRCHRHSLAKQLLDGFQRATLRRFAERNCNTSGARATGAADAMHVALSFYWDIEVNHVTDAVHVNAARGDIGGHQDARLASLESIERALALALVLVSVNGSGVDSRANQALHDAVGAVLGACEDHHAGHVI
jgi:hypothetical protein